jgi:hypothetical protein
MMGKNWPEGFELYAAITRFIEDCLLRLVGGRGKVALIWIIKMCSKHVRPSYYSKSLV